MHRGQCSSSVDETFNHTHIMQVYQIALAYIIIDHYIWCIVFRIPSHRSNDHWQSACVLNSFSIVNNSPNYLVILYSMTKNSFTWHHCFIGGPCFLPCMTGKSWNQFTWGTDSHQNLLIYYSISLTIFTSYECIQWGYGLKI